MKKVIVFALLVVILGSCRKEPLVPPLPPDSSIPTLSWAIASFATVTRFYPFGDPKLGNPANTGYQMMMTDSNAGIFSACTGIVQSITPDGNGGNSVLIKYKNNSVYSFLYSGIGHVNVHVNDSLQNSALIGTIAHNGIMGFSLIKNGHEAICPSLLGAESFNNSILTAMNQNNAITPEDSVFSPCVVDSIPF